MPQTHPPPPHPFPNPAPAPPHPPDPDAPQPAPDTTATDPPHTETYTWDVLPEGLKMDLLESIGREYDWVLRTCSGFAGMRRAEGSGATGRPEVAEGREWSEPWGPGEARRRRDSPPDE